MIINDQEFIKAYNDMNRNVNYLMGKVMKATKGKADPLTTRNLIIEKLYIEPFKNTQEAQEIDKLVATL